MKTLLLVASLCLCSPAWAQFAPIGFEDRPPAETTIPGWTMSGAGISAEAAHGGSQSLSLAPVATASRVIAEWPQGQKVAWVDFWIKPVADVSAEPVTTIDIDGAKLAFVAGDGEGTGEIFVWDGRGEGQSVSTGVTFDAAGWVRITLREDFASSTWDLFVDGRPVKGDLGLDNPTEKAGPALWSFAGASAGAEVTYLDDLQLSIQSILFEDQNNNGLPDAYERAKGFALNGDSRSMRANSVSAADQESAFEQFVQASAEHADGGSSRFIYVDKQHGQDANAGRLSYAIAGDGPKATIRAAMKVAQPGDTIAVLEGVYDEGSISLQGKPFNLTTLGTVKF